MVYNTNLVPPDKAPKKWMDLCGPFFRGNFSFDPVQSRLVSGFYALFGADTVNFIRCLGNNKPIVQRGIQERFTLMMAGDHMIDADAYPYQAIDEKRKNPNVPLAISPAPVLAGFGAIGINRNTTHPYASALFTDFMLSDAEQNFLYRHLRGPVTMKHPYLPDNADLVVIPNLPSETLDPLVDEWKRDLDSRQ
jgi:ABC-type Fe3+ transport system substrate-binding protein